MRFIYFLIFLVVIFCSAIAVIIYNEYSDQKQIQIKTKSKHNSPLKTIIHSDSCEYVLWDNGYGSCMVHSGNCHNKNHNK